MKNIDKKQFIKGAFRLLNLLRIHLAYIECTYVIYPLAFFESGIKYVYDIMSSILPPFIKILLYYKYIQAQLLISYHLKTRCYVNTVRI